MKDERPGQARTPDDSSSGAQDQGTQRRKAPRHKSNSVYLHRPAAYRQMWAVRSIAPKTAWLGVWATYLGLVIQIADDRDGGAISYSDRAIARTLFMARATWDKHRDALIAAGLLEPMGSQRNADDDRITYRLPAFGEITGLIGEPPNDPHAAGLSKQGGLDAGLDAGLKGGPTDRPATGRLPAPSLTDPQDPQDSQDPQDQREEEPLRASRETGPTPWDSLGGVA